MHIFPLKLVGSGQGVLLAGGREKVGGSSAKSRKKSAGTSFRRQGRVQKLHLGKVLRKPMFSYVSTMKCKRCKFVGRGSWRPRSLVKKEKECMPSARAALHAPGRFSARARSKKYCFPSSL